MSLGDPAFARAVACTFFALALTAPAAAGEQPEWSVLVARGPAEYRAAGSADWQPLAPDGTVPGGSEVRTGRGGLLLLEAAGDVVRIGPDGVLVLPAPGAQAEVTQQRGSAHYVVRSAPGRRFGVRTPWLALTVKGTSFGVTVDDAQAEVEVESGVVEVTPAGSDESERLGAGARGRVRAAARGKVELVRLDRPRTGPAPAAVEHAKGRPFTDGVPGRGRGLQKKKPGGLWGWLGGVFESGITETAAGDPGKGKGKGGGNGNGKGGGNGNGGGNGGGNGNGNGNGGGNGGGKK